MDKGALLMLLCLQAFLLITTVPSSEAAALLREDLTPPDRRVDLTALERLKIRRPKRGSGCWGRAGACSGFKVKQTAFLLITTVPSSEAAVLLREDLTPPDRRAFLLITTVPSSEAAVLLREDLTPPDRRPPPDKPEDPNPPLLVALGKHT
ncbi:hypothetical protein JOQ06_000981, partial [Pogonophryne albipinna]